jgi:RHS repeat-associated protein
MLHQNRAEGASGAQPDAKPPPEPANAFGSLPVPAPSLARLPQIAPPERNAGIRGIDESFRINPATGSASLSIPLTLTPGREGFGPSLALTYDSGAGQGLFGQGWTLDLPRVVRRTDHRLPCYRDATDADVFRLGGGEDLVPVPLAGLPAQADWRGEAHDIRCYQPRVEAAFQRIERWTRRRDGRVHWRSIAPGNVVTLFGTEDAARLLDPAAPHRVFAWLASAMFNGRGDAIRIIYKPEDDAGLAAGRAARPEAQRHPKRILYGFRTPAWADQPLEARADHLFEAVFDYGEHDATAPRAEEPGIWRARRDAITDHRAGFPLSTRRLCQRLLMFHHVPEDARIGRDGLVASWRFEYAAPDDPGSDPRTGHATGSLLRRVTRQGHRRDGAGYTTQRLPMLELDYQLSPFRRQDRLAALAAMPLDAASLGNLPSGLANPEIRFLDLDGEGAPGMLLDTGDALYYKRNLSPLDPEAPPRFGALEPLGERASALSLRRGEVMALDVDGDGALELVSLDPPLAGFQPRRRGGGFESFRAFEEVPRLPADPANRRFIDLDGDGLPDILVTEGDAILWYPSRGAEGFGAPVSVAPGPRLVFGSDRECLFLADMDGDGLVDLVRVRGGEVCHWPNLGHGQFGPKVTMGNAPRLDADGGFDARRLRMADLDGNGTADLVYLTSAGAIAALNQGGQDFADAVPLPGLPRYAEGIRVEVLDLKGCGRPCLVWSSALPEDVASPLRCIDLSAGGRAHLLRRIDPNSGTETRLEYLPSTHFQVRDHAAGRPWVTQLPMPVQVVARMETIDHVGQSRRAVRYAYRHGHFDAVEREFRGFAMVEQHDSEILAGLDATIPHAAPMVTRSWFHTGALDQPTRLAAHFRATEWWQDGSLAAPPDITFEAGLRATAAAEAARALRGRPLRVEVFAEDGGPRADTPYSVVETGYHVRRLQPGVFLVHPTETRTRHQERDPAEARLTQDFALEVNRFGQVERSLQVAHGRAAAQLPDARDRAAQARRWIGLTETIHTEPVATLESWRTPLPCLARSYEVVALPPPARLFYEVEEIRTALAPLAAIAPLAPEDAAGAEAAEAAGQPTWRLLGCDVTLYRAEDFTLAPFGRSGALGLPAEAWRLVATRAFADAILLGQGGLDAAALAALLTEAGYRDSAALRALAGPTAPLPEGIWQPGGQVFYSADPADGPAAELAAARAGFFRPRRARDAFGAVSTVTWDSFHLLPIETRDALGNRTSNGSRDAAGLLTPRLDYRDLAAELITDANGNETALARDALGLVRAQALRGQPGAPSGDSLAGVVLDPDAAALAALLADPLVGGAALLGAATTLSVTDALAFERTRSAPRWRCHLSRETHGPGAALQASVDFLAGDGATVQAWAPADDAPDGTPRWVVSGWVLRDGKGHPVREFEPFFETSPPRFLPAVLNGVAATHLYDPPGRQVATLLPDRSWRKTVHGPWHTESWDANDTVTLDPLADPDLGEAFARLPAGLHQPGWHAARIGGALGPLERVAAERAAAHANTPQQVHLDALGRPVLTRELRPGAAAIETRARHDAAGHVVEVLDPLGRSVQRTRHDLIGRPWLITRMDAGERCSLPALDGQVILALDARGHRLRFGFDALRRATTTRLLAPGGGGEVTVERHEYGDAPGLAGAAAANLRGRVHRSFDRSGSVTVAGYDLHGNPTATTRRFMANAAAPPDWAALAAADGESFTTRAEHDALSRPVRQTSPDGTLLAYAHGCSGQVSAITLTLPGGAAETVLRRVARNARGQRIVSEAGNGCVTTLEHDPLTFRVTRIHTTRPQAPRAVQDLSYTYDPVGNVTAIRDASDPAALFGNAAGIAGSGQDFRYDALYRLVEATGREHPGQAGAPWSDAFDGARSLLAHPADAQALQRYTERYDYDEAGNMTRLRHEAGPLGSWTRAFFHESPHDGGVSNRLTRVTVGAETRRYAYDAHGNMLALDSARRLDWDHADRLEAAELLGGGSVLYRYDAGGARTRKRWAQAGGIVEETLCLGPFELRRTYSPTGALTLERSALRILDDGMELLSVERRTAGQDGGVALLHRYACADMLDSRVLELDGAAEVISVEAFHPFGSTAFRNLRANVSKSRRFTGQQRDAETGLNYQGARYLAPWLCRWCGADPAGFVDGTNLYAYVRNNPLRRGDPSGCGGDPPPVDNRVISLGIWRQEGRWPRLWPTSVPSGNGNVAQGFLMSDAGRNTGLRPMLLSDLPGFNDNFTRLFDIRGNPNGQYTGLASGMAVQEVFEGQGARSLHFDTTNVRVLGRGQTAGELRSLIGNLAAGNNEHVDVHIYENGQLSTIPRGTSQVVGAPLPARIAERLPNIAPPAPAGGAPPAAPQAPPPATPPPAAATPPRPATTPTPRPAAPSAPAAPPSSGGRGAAVVNFAGNGAQMLGRAVPGVIEAEVGLQAGAFVARSYGMAATGATLEAGAAGVPVAGAALLVGTFAGHGGEALATHLGATPAQAQTSGLLAAVGSGAAIGALAGAPVGGIGAGPGAVVGAVAGGVGYLVSRYW